MKLKKTPTVTLQAIGKLIDRKFDQRLFPVHKGLGNLNTKIVGIYGEFDGIKQQIVGLDSKIDGVDAKIEIHRKETKKGFEDVYGSLGNIADVLDHDFEPRLKHLEAKAFA